MADVGFGSTHASVTIIVKEPVRRTVRFLGALMLGISLWAGAAGSAVAKASKSAKTPSAKSQRSKTAIATAKKATEAKAAMSSLAPAAVPDDIRKLGPLSVGHPHAGFLVNAVKMPSAPQWVLTVPSHGFATQETVDGLAHCLRKVHEQFPHSPPVMLGSLSGEHGGLLPPHKSHRTGRDADVYFFRKPGASWARAATRDDIDLPRTWALLRCFLTDVDVDMVLIVRRVQNWIEEYALSIGEDPAWVNRLFHDPKPGYKIAPVRDVPGHVAHMHVRFSSPRARRAAVAAYDRLVKTGVVRPEVASVEHEVVKGDTLSELGVKYHLSVKRIQELNDLKSTVIRLGQKLVLQQAVDIRGARDKVYLPGRHPAPFTPSPPADSAVAVATREPDDGEGASAVTEPPGPGAEVTGDKKTPRRDGKGGKRSKGASDKSAQPARRANGWL